MDGTPPSYFYERVGNISAYFINDHDFLQPPRPRLPTTHLIGGPEGPRTPLPPIPPVEPPAPCFGRRGERGAVLEELLSFMEGNHSGVIVMSLSTISRSVHMPPDFMDAFRAAFTRYSFAHSFKR